MQSPKPLPNDPYAWIEKASEDLLASAESAVTSGEAAMISDEAVKRIMTAAIKLYVSKTDGEERTFRPVVGRRDEHITPTEVISATSELLRALHLGPMELALWYRVRPERPLPEEPLEMFDADGNPIPKSAAE